MLPHLTVPCSWLGCSGNTPPPLWHTSLWRSDNSRQLPAKTVNEELTSATYLGLTELCLCRQILKMPVPTSPDEETEELTARRASRRVSFANRFHVQWVLRQLPATWTDTFTRHSESWHTALRAELRFSRRDVSYALIFAPFVQEPIDFLNRLSCSSGYCLPIWGTSVRSGCLARSLDLSIRFLQWP